MTTLTPPLTPEEVTYYERRAAQEGWAHDDLVALDQFLNSAAFRWMQKWEPDQTMSQHFYEAAQGGNKLAKVMTWMLDKIQADHGAKATAGDLERAEQQESAAAKDLGVDPT